MNQKAYSILFCALLGSTFVHELQAKGVAPVKPALKAHHRHGLAAQERGGGNNSCYFECSPSAWVPVPSGLTLYANGSLIGIVNTTAIVGIIIDLSANLVALLNGNSGEALIINLANQTGVYIKNGIWVAANGGFKAYLAGLSGLTSLLLTAGAVAFTVAAITTAVLAVVNGVIIYLVAGIRPAIVDDANAGIKVVLAVGNGIVPLFKGVLSPLLGLISGLAIPLVGDLVSFFNVCQGLAIVFGNMTGGVAALIQATVIIDLSIILGANNGLQVLIYILNAIGTKVALGALGVLLGNVQALFQLIELLGGSINGGITGLFGVLGAIVALVNQKTTIDFVISIIIQFVVATKVNLIGDLGAELNATCQGLLDVVNQNNLTTTLSGLVTTVAALINGTLSVAAVNISLIIQKIVVGLLSTTATLLYIIVDVLLQLESAVASTISLAYLVFILIVYLKCYVGVLILKALGMVITGSFVGIIGGILALILGSETTLVQMLLGNLYDALASIPIFGVILVAVSAAVTAASGGTLNLKTLLNANALVGSFIKGLIQLITGLSLIGIGSAVIAQVQALLAVLSTVVGFFSLGIYVSVGGSISATGGSNSSVVIGK